MTRPAAPPLDPAREALFRFVRSLPSAAFLQTTLTEGSFVEENPRFYLEYPRLFGPCFGLAPDDPRLERLCWAGYLYYCALIAFDKLLDGAPAKSGTPPPSPATLLLTGLTCQEESIKLLTGLFGETGEFWQRWNQRKAEYYGAMKLERQPGLVLDEAAYVRFADHKSAFGHMGIEGAFLLAAGADSGVRAALLESHRWFSAGFQVLDDYVDFREDFETQQFNHAHQALRAHFGDDAAAWAARRDPALLHKQFHLSGVAETLLADALAYFDRATAAVAHLPGSEAWQRVVYLKRQDALLLKLRIGGYLETLRVRVRRVQTRPAEPPSLAEGVENAVAFVVGEQEADGSWRDIYNNAGLSNVWATAYVAQHLGAVPHPAARAAVERAGRFLIDHRQNGLWGYNTDWIADTDSTTCALLALHRGGFPIADDLATWAGGQQPDGGFTTYPDTPALLRSLDYRVPDAAGWTQSHPCVSALAYCLLETAGTTATAPARQRLEAYLARTRRADDRWPSYWWTSGLYATACVLKGYWQRHAPDYRTRPVLATLLAQQHPTGAFGDGFGGESPFYTALVLDALATHPAAWAFARYRAERAARWLLGQQHADGSFAPTAALRIPAPDVRDPDTVPDWPVGHRYTNIRTDDFRRLFSTAAAAAALATHQLRTTQA